MTIKMENLVDSRTFFVLRSTRIWASPTAIRETFNANGVLLQNLIVF
jgi:hypothetical protein